MQLHVTYHEAIPNARSFDPEAKNGDGFGGKLANYTLH
jgi:hypothetical protein